ncbi:MAG: hypothetical protein KC466_20145 [Myxococcales bacterium]|nr:hypothetical protein [Myxococcales bacterium]
MSRYAFMAHALAALLIAAPPFAFGQAAGDEARQRELERRLEQLQRAQGSANPSSPTVGDLPPGSDAVMRSDPEALIRSLEALRASGQTEGQGALVDEALRTFARAQEARRRAAESRGGRAGDDPDDAELERIAAQQRELQALLDRLLANP